LETQAIGAGRHQTLKTIGINMNHIARIAYEAMLCVSLLSFVGCCVHQHSSNKSSPVAAAIISAQEQDIVILFEELKVLERTKQRLASRAEEIPINVQSEAEKTKNALCSDSAYFCALQAFHKTMTNRSLAIQTEIGIYHNWLFSDRGLISTNRNIKGP
jgi:hypothetical protein